MQALAAGDAKRLARVALKRQVAAGDLDVADLILDPPEILRCSRTARKPITVAVLLSWQRRWQTTRAENFLRTLRISPTATPFDLSLTRRHQIVRALG